ncbi:unnamed protein product [Pylaiella littoralis]
MLSTVALALLCLVRGAGGSSTAWSPEAWRAEKDATDLPIVAVWAQPADSLEIRKPYCGGGDCDAVQASYVNWLASAGVRSLPIGYDATPEEVKPILDGVNGLLLPGGTTPRASSVRWALEYAKELNDGGDFFPVWGTCLGWEWIAEAFAGDYPIVTVGFDAENFTQPLGLLPDADESRILSGFSDEMLEEMATEPLATNAHHKGVAPDDLVKSGLDEMFRVVSTNTDKNGVREYVSIVEAFDYPMYGLQWHPEKSEFDSGVDPDGTPHHIINHTKDAVKLSQAMVKFFASETRHNGHSFADITEWEPKMLHTLPVTPTGPRYGQLYFFPSIGADRGMSDEMPPSTKN